MSIENNGTTNGAPKGKMNTSLTMLAGDFLKLLTQENYLENGLNNSNVTSYLFKSVREGDTIISIGLEPNTTKDVVFLQYMEQNPIAAKAKRTKEEWEKILIEFMNRNKRNDMDKN